MNVPENEGTRATRLLLCRIQLRNHHSRFWSWMHRRKDRFSLGTNALALQRLLWRQGNSLSGVVLKTAIPGVNVQDISTNVVGDMLSVKAESKAQANSNHWLTAWLRIHDRLAPSCCSLCRKNRTANQFLEHRWYRFCSAFGHG